MTMIEPGAACSGLVARVKAILTQPSATWDVIDGETPTVAELYRGYVMPLAAIPAVCSLVGLLIFGVGGFGFSYHLSPVWLIAQAVVGYVLSLAMVFVMALIIEALAPTFGGTKDRMQAFKLAAYAPTASWIAGVFGLVPALAIVAILGGLYSLYILYEGLPKLMRTPPDKALPYVAVVVLVAIVVSIVIGIATGSVLAMSGGMRVAGAPGQLSGTVNVPGGGKVDLGKLEAASKQMQDGSGPAATDPEVLKAYLPANVAGFTRTEVSASRGGVGGVQGSGAEGTYSRGDASLRLEVTDLGAAGALAGMASAFNVKSSKETSSGYEKVGKVAGRLTQESYDHTSRHGEYSVLIADRFMVQASGDGVTMDELKAAVNSVGAGRLEGLAKAS